jgi:hypothetical protein
LACMLFLVQPVHGPGYQSGSSHHRPLASLLPSRQARAGPRLIRASPSTTGGMPEWLTRARNQTALMLGTPNRVSGYVDAGGSQNTRSEARGGSPQRASIRACREGAQTRRRPWREPIGRQTATGQGPARGPVWGGLHCWRGSGGRRGPPLADQDLLPRRETRVRVRLSGGRATRRWTDGRDPCQCRVSLLGSSEPGVTLLFCRVARRFRFGHAAEKGAEGC